MRFFANVALNAVTLGLIVWIACLLGCEPKVTTTQLPPQPTPQRDGPTMTRYSFSYDYRAATEFVLTDGTRCVYAAGPDTAFVTCGWKEAK